MSNTSSFILNYEFWFIPFDIFMILCSTIAVLLSIIFLFIIIFDKTLHTIPMMLVANSCLAEFIFGSVMLTSAIFTFHNDIKQMSSYDSLCILRGFLGYVSTILQNYSYLIQAIYRYILVIYPNKFYWQSIQFQLILISLIWIISIICPLPYLISNEIQYNLDNQICQMPLIFSFLSIYNALCVYIIPISLIIFIYFKLICYVRKINKNIMSVYIYVRVKRELKMVRQIVILVVGVATIGFPYALFLIWGCFTTPPKYHFRIAYFFVHSSLTFVMIALYEFTEQLKTSILKRIRRRINVISPIVS